MTDDRHNPAGPPPMASAPPPAPPLAPSPPLPPSYPVAAPVYAPPERRSNAGWIVAAILAAVLVLLVILYFTGALDREPRRSGFASGASGSSGRTGFGSSTTTAGAPLSMSALVGTWGPRCPGSRAEAITFTSGGTWTAGSGGGSYSLSGNTITLFRSSGGGTFSMRWEPVTDSSARVSTMGAARPDYVYRCGL